MNLPDLEPELFPVLLSFDQHTWAVLRLDWHEVHVWRINLRELPAEILWPWLSRVEQEQALKLGLETVASQKFIQSRGQLRGVLSQYLACHPADLEFGYGRYGKPMLINGDLEFNWSHSGGIALCGITTVAAIGIDVEQIKLCAKAQAIAQRYFSPHDQAHLQELSGQALTLEFLRLWTHWEAQLKATGASIFAAQESKPTSGAWPSLSFRLGQAYIASLVVCSEEAWEVKLWQPAWELPPLSSNN